MTDQEFKNEFASLTRLKDTDIETIIKDAGIGKQDLAAVLKAVKDASADNEAKAQSILNINNGVSALVAIASRFI